MYVCQQINRYTQLYMLQCGPQKAFPMSINTYTHTFNGPFSGTTLVSRYQKGKTNLEFTAARDSE